MCFPGSPFTTLQTLFISLGAQTRCSKSCSRTDILTEIVQIAPARIRGPYATQACTVCRGNRHATGLKPVCGSCIASGRDEEIAVPRKPRNRGALRGPGRRVDSLQAYVQASGGVLHRALWVAQDCSGDETTGSGGLLPHGITAPTSITFITAPQIKLREFRWFDNPGPSWMLSQTHPDIDWSRYLPPEVHLGRREHDKILALSFKFFTMWTFRVVPYLFLRDMYRALSVPRSEEPPRTPHYSPMLHNAVLAISAVFSDDPYIRDPATRQYFVRASRAGLMVHALAFIGTYYANEGERVQAELFFGMSTRLSMTHSYSWARSRFCAMVKTGLITHDEMIGRNWAHWTLFSLDVCWALTLGGEYGGPPRRNTPMPFMPWYHAPANIPPQPNYLTLVFFETSALFVIARQITDVVCVLRSLRLSSHTFD
ncbi:hypothetical protein B0H14DRAFT_2930012, partial [Mycena olivaceomarginata]